MVTYYRQVVHRSKGGRILKRKFPGENKVPSSAPTDHPGWLEKEAVLRQKVKTQKEYSEKDLKKWLSDRPARH